MKKSQIIAPEHTAVRVALWRALHVQIDSLPHVLADEVGMKLAGETNWRMRPDMDPAGSSRVRASIVARARFVEDLVQKSVNQGVRQYVILGAGLDSFAQRRSDICAKLKIFEIDQPGPQAWKQKRLIETGFGIPDYLRFVPVDFEAGTSWWDELISKGFDPSLPTLIVSTGVTMYLTREANQQTFAQMARLAPGSLFVTTYLLPLDKLESIDRQIQEFTMKKASEAGTPFISLFVFSDLEKMSLSAGFKSCDHVSGEDIRQLYYTNRTDGLMSASAEEILIAKK